MGRYRRIAVILVSAVYVMGLLYYGMSFVVMRDPTTVGEWTTVVFNVLVWPIWFLLELVL